MTKVEELEQEVKNIKVVIDQTFALTNTIEILTGGIERNEYGSTYYEYHKAMIEMVNKMYVKRDELAFELAKALEESNNGKL